MMYNINNNKSNKYFILSNLIKTIKTIKYNINSNITNILLSLLILISSISINNNTYAKAKLTDTVSVIIPDINGCESTCRDKYTLVKSELVEVKRENRSVSICQSSSCYDSRWCKKEVFRRCVDNRSVGVYYVFSVKFSGAYSDAFRGVNVIFYNLRCTYKGYNELWLTEKSGSKEEDCNNAVKDKLNKCISECRSRKSRLIIGNKEIKTVGDLLDSIPATELLKVYDPNMVN